MKRTPMKRGAGFKRPVYERAKQPLYRVERHAPSGSMDMRTGPIEKENAIQHEGYMRLVRQLPCAHCGRPGSIHNPTQFCHADEGKGKSIKTDCRRGYPGCGDDLASNRIGCHTLLGSTGKMPRTIVRILAAQYAAQTRKTIIERGQWPADLPLWQEDE